MYLVDANVLIQAKNGYYAFDIAPGFWEWIDQAHDQGRVFSIDKVRDELFRGDDELSDWTKGHRDFFHPVDQLTTPFFTPLSTWAHSSGLHPGSSG
ncbi:DUF4411 family protein [Actinomyces wuliandei]|uniref:DUF4411 family protein n=1 Tax=Actinomyces wuliandei TaxID=2057743 RepID=UPI00214BE7EF|nr:DUF4411 family protein [Actinomyces wuliandei]